jgi:hypothetical protein
MRAGRASYNLTEPNFYLALTPYTKECVQMEPTEASHGTLSRYSAMSCQDTKLGLSDPSSIGRNYDAGSSL